MKIDEEKIEEFIDGVHSIATALRNLGTADAATPMGAVEVLAKEVCEGTGRLASATEMVAHSLAEGLQAVSEGLIAVASAINRHTDSQ